MDGGDGEEEGPSWTLYWKYELLTLFSSFCEMGQQPRGFTGVGGILLKISSVLKGIVCKYVHINICRHCTTLNTNEKHIQYLSVGELSSVFLLFLSNTAEYFKLSLMLQISKGVSSFSLHFSWSLSLFCLYMWARQKMNPDQSLMMGLRNGSVWDRLGLLRRTELICCTRMKTCFIPRATHVGITAPKVLLDPFCYRQCLVYFHDKLWLVKKLRFEGGCVGRLMVDSVAHKTDGSWAS